MEGKFLRSHQVRSPTSWKSAIFSSLTIYALIFVTFSKLSITQPNSLPIKSTLIVLFTSAAVVITGREFRKLDTYLDKALAPPKWPDKVLITKVALSSITNTAGSVFLSTRSFEINLITAPKEKIQIKASYEWNRSSIFFWVDSLNQIILEFSLYNL